MRVVRFSVPVEEWDALVAMAESDYRHPANEARWLIVLEARRRGLLEVEE